MLRGSRYKMYWAIHVQLPCLPLTRLTLVGKRRSRPPHPFFPSFSPLSSPLPGISHSPMSSVQFVHVSAALYSCELKYRTVL